MVDHAVGHWFRAIDSVVIESEIASIHDRVSEQVRAKAPICLASGLCCKFDAFDHRLYATGLEAARCVSVCENEGRGIHISDVHAARNDGNCPWQSGRLCMARSGRPVGCRVFYCDPRASKWVPEIAEWAHSEMKSLHERHEIPYMYGEWRVMLESVLDQWVHRPRAKSVNLDSEVDTSRTLPLKMFPDSSPPHTH